MQQQLAAADDDNIYEEIDCDSFQVRVGAGACADARQHAVTTAGPETDEAHSQATSDYRTEYAKKSLFQNDGSSDGGRVLSRKNAIIIRKSRVRSTRSAPTTGEAKTDDHVTVNYENKQGHPPEEDDAVYSQTEVYADRRRTVLPTVSTTTTRPVTGNFGVYCDTELYEQLNAVSEMNTKRQESDPTAGVKPHQQYRSTLSADATPEQKTSPAYSVPWKNVLGSSKAKQNAKLRHAKPAVSKKPAYLQGTKIQSATSTNGGSSEGSSLEHQTQLPDGEVYENVSETRQLSSRQTNGRGDNEGRTWSTDWDEEWDDDVDDDDANDGQNSGDKSSSSTEELYMNDSELRTNKSEHEVDGHQGQALTKVQHIVEEFLKTEKDYVDRLRLIAEEFHHALNLTNQSDRMIPDDVMQLIFSNIQSIYQLHQTFLLPQFELCSVRGGEKQRVGEVLKKLAPFLKIYADYIKNYDAAVKAIETWKTRSPKFAKFIASFQQRPSCGQLAVQHHMLEPVQRLPRYKLLLEDYIRHLPEDSSDRLDAQDALELVKEAATHCNEIINNTSCFYKLVEISRSLWGDTGLVTPTRLLVKEGKINRISKKNKGEMERYMYLFNDLVLVCHIIPLGLSSQYKVEYKLDVYDLKIIDEYDGVDPVVFGIQNKQRKLYFHPSSVEEKEDWLAAFQRVLTEFDQTVKPRLRLALGREETVKEEEEELGSQAPAWIKDEDASVCMICCVEFTAVQRRHHCRACGIVVCKDCSAYKVALAYNNDRENRVCENCFVIISEQNRYTKSPENKLLGFQSNRPLALKADVSRPAEVEGFMLISRCQRSWQKRWFRLQNDNILYSFSDPKDVTAESAVLLLGYELALAIGHETAVDSDYQEFGSSFKFTLTHRMRKPFYFRTPGHEDLARWLCGLKGLVNPDRMVQKTNSNPLSALFQSSRA